jgi:hypothetical protein
MDVISPLCFRDSTLYQKRSSGSQRESPEVERSISELVIQIYNRITLFRDALCSLAVMYCILLLLQRSVSITWKPPSLEIFMEIASSLVRRLLSPTARGILPLSDTHTLHSMLTSNNDVKDK